jgi:hypothetical protein
MFKFATLSCHPRHPPSSTTSLSSLLSSLPLPFPLTRTFEDNGTHRYIRCCVLAAKFFYFYFYFYFFSFIWSTNVERSSGFLPTSSCATLTVVPTRHGPVMATASPQHTMLMWPPHYASHIPHPCWHGLGRHITRPCNTTMPHECCLTRPTTNNTSLPCHTQVPWLTNAMSLCNSCGC